MHSSTDNKKTVEKNPPTPRKSRILRIFYSIWNFGVEVDSKGETIQDVLITEYLELFKILDNAIIVEKEIIGNLKKHNGKLMNLNRHRKILKMLEDFRPNLSGCYLEIYKNRKVIECTNKRYLHFRSIEAVRIAIEKRHG